MSRSIYELIYESLAEILSSSDDGLEVSELIRTVNSKHNDESKVREVIWYMVQHQRFIYVGDRVILTLPKQRIK